MKKCSICEDGHDRYLCPKCAADPINSEWNDGEESQTTKEEQRAIKAVAWGVATIWNPDDLFERTVRFLSEGVSERETAILVGRSRGFVRKVAAKVGLR